MNTPVLGHSVAVIVKVCGKDKLAKKLLKEANSNMNSLVNSMPVIGHIKGLVHYALDDKEAGHEAIASASRTIVMVVAGATGFFVAGPVGAAVSRTQMGLVWDTGVNYLSNGKTKLGVYQTYDNPSDPRSYVGAISSVLSDALGS